jgi:cell division septum initiation protein DivIVA
LATKGDKAILAPQAQRLYADGHNLSAISVQLGVSVTSLAKWKSETLVPGQPMDEWDRARSQKRGNIQRLRDLFEDQLAYLENQHASERTAPMMDTLSKVGSLLERWDKMEKAQRVAEDVVKTVTKAGITPETADDIRRQILGINA